ncbi:hypothetical protein [Crenothrix polyspora]|uniref:Uncharacterized protein n=1 Tax=Crenothrix polyspora TaxID=360316 RepID=A0A1R4H3I1_9GAMM|nr:hypothetical protein [Crenothrix polyspora]SJM90784.1 exported hypothetical protein [Crenothrix polyspora]
MFIKYLRYLVAVPLFCVGVPIVAALPTQAAENKLPVKRRAEPPKVEEPEYIKMKTETEQNMPDNTSQKQIKNSLPLPKKTK